MEHLPEELCLHLLKFLPVEDVITCARLNRQWRNICEDENLWKEMCNQRWFMTRKFGNEDTMLWKQVYTSRWRTWSRCSSMKLASDLTQPDLITLDEDSRLEIKYLGQHWAEDDTVGVAVSEKPLIPLPFGDVPVYAYFEMNVIDSAEHGFVALGLADSSFPLLRMQPGWRAKTVGFHGDDGVCYIAGKAHVGYSRPYGTGSIVGCIYNVCSGDIRFTRGEDPLDMAPGRLPPDARVVHAVVATHSLDECVRANFGAHSFSFPVGEYIQHEQGDMDSSALSCLADQVAEFHQTVNSAIGGSTLHSSNLVEFEWIPTNTYLDDIYEMLKSPENLDNAEFVRILKYTAQQLGVSGKRIRAMSKEELANSVRLHLILFQDNMGNIEDAGDDEDGEDDEQDGEDDELDDAFLDSADDAEFDEEAN